MITEKEAMLVGFVVAAIVIYLLPTWIAIGKRRSFLIFMTNLVFGATGAGWIVALIWAICTPKKEKIKIRITIYNPDNIVDPSFTFEGPASLKEAGNLIESLERCGATVVGCKYNEKSGEGISLNTAGVIPWPNLGWNKSAFPFWDDSKGGR
jgi:hypothetical protein